MLTLENPASFGANSGDDRQKVKIGMCAPSVRIGPRGLRLLSPSRKTETDHFPPRVESAQIFIPHANMVESSRQVKSEIVRCFRHFRNLTTCLETRITYRKNFIQHVLLLFPWNNVEPGSEDIGVLAEMLLRWRIGNQAVVFVPA